MDIRRLEAEILDPLEMRRTSRLPRAPHAQGFAVQPWADVILPEAVHDLGRMASAGQLWSTVEDLGRLTALLLGGADDVLTADTVAEMRAPQSAPQGDSWDTSYGLGMQTFRSGGRILAGHTGSVPGYVCALWVPGTVAPLPRGGHRAAGAPRPVVLGGPPPSRCGSAPTARSSSRP